MEPRGAVLAFGAGLYLPVQQVRENLLAVTDAQDRRRLLQEGWINSWAGGIVYAGRAAGDDDAACAQQFGNGRIAGANIGVNTEFAYLSGDEVTVLATGIENGNLRAYFAILWTIIFLAEFKSACAFGNASTAFRTAGSVDFSNTRLSSLEMPEK